MTEEEIDNVGREAVRAHFARPGMIRFPFDEDEYEEYGILGARALAAAMRGEVEQQKQRGDNHWETLRSIREIARTSGDLERIIQWVNDAGSGYIETNEATMAALMDSVADLQAAVEILKRAFNEPGCAVFLDGRNEHGSHVLMSYPTNIPEDAQNDIEAYAEEILAAAEALGFKLGEDHVWTVWRWNKPQYGDEGRVELSSYWEFVRIDAELTRAALTFTGDDT